MKLHTHLSPIAKPFASVAEGSQDSTRGRRATRTSAFGISRRESHDASRYYGSRLNEGLASHRDVGERREYPDAHLDKVMCCDSTSLAFLPDNCVHLMVTSPPYNACKDYDENLLLDEYLDMLTGVFAECYRVLVPGGRAVVNVANLGRKPYIALSSRINALMEEIGFLMRGEVIWDKSASAGSSCAWGSFQSASNPCLRDVHEYILIYSKGDYRLPRSKEERNQGREDSIARDEFIEYTKSIWRFPTESARKIGHPAPFPVELPRRCIEMYTFRGDIVLDPFMGSGSTCIAALRTQRNYLGIDIDEEYCELARQRILKEEQILVSPQHE